MVKSKRLVTNECILLSIEELNQMLRSNETPLTYSQFADKFGYKISTVRKKVSRGEIPKAKLPNGKPVIYLSQFNGAINA